MIEICVCELERHPDYIKFLNDGHFQSNILTHPLKVLICMYIQGKTATMLVDCLH